MRDVVLFSNGANLNLKASRYTSTALLIRSPIWLCILGSLSVAYKADLMVYWCE